VTSKRLVFQFGISKEFNATQRFLISTRSGASSFGRRENPHATRENLELNRGSLRIPKVKISKVAGLIHVVRGLRVILDEDLALLYGVPTKILNQAVRRNIQRFPGDFLIQLTREESLVLRSQIVTLKKRGSGRGRKYLPLAFTEQGVAMLSGVLNSDRAVEINIAIMRAFVMLRQALMADTSLAARMENAEHALQGLESEQGEQAVAIHEILAAFRRLKV
jgi:hypothetical protein